LPRGYDPRADQRPGVESGMPKILISPAAMATLPAAAAFQAGDRLTQVATGRVFRVAAVFAMAGGSMKLRVNLAA
jgi:hypothetical protein